ncbi:transposase, partial [Paenibacillus sp.]|uniref:transposase n=1 Tax=Paenibacillus sp. TaxID=58172 RepID=UPI0028AA48F5
EDLSGVRHVTEKVRVKDRYVQVSWAFYQFRQMLEYKAGLNGQKVITVDPRYTSQTCPKCGHPEKGNRNKKLHIFCCKKCHYTSNDDRIAAMNIHRKGIKAIRIGATPA